jgi:hypothetical protein
MVPLLPSSADGIILMSQLNLILEGQMYEAPAIAALAAVGAARREGGNGGSSSTTSTMRSTLGNGSSGAQGGSLPQQLSLVPEATVVGLHEKLKEVLTGLVVIKKEAKYQV